MSNQGSYSEALADDVRQHIHNRETLIERLDKLHRESVLSRSNRVQRLLYGLHNASLAAVEAITAWNLSKQDDWSRQKNRDFNCSHLGVSFNCDRSESKESPCNAIDASITAQSCPTNFFLWNGENYLQKMISDLDFVRDIPEALTFLGSGCPFHRNPFLLPLDIDELASLTRPDGTKQDALLTKMSNNPWKDVNVHRVRRAAFHILLDEYHRQHRHFLNGMQSRSSDRETHMIYPSCLSREAMNSAFFYPPELSLDNLIEYFSMVDPPVSAVIAVSCARLLLNSVDEDITNKLVFLTKPIVLKIFRLPINELTEKATAYNPLHQVDQKIVRIIYPFVMHREMNPDLMTDVSDKIIYLSMWLRALVSREAVSDYASNISVDIDRLFLELKVDHQPKKSVQKGIRSPMTKLFVGNANKENEDGHENRLVNQSIQTEESMISEDNDSLNKCKFLEAKLGAELECKQLVPFPVAVTVNVIEGSQIVTVNGSMEAVCIFKQGDIVRIYDAYKSSDWEISSTPKDEDGISFEISDVYDHSRIRAEEEKSRDDTLNRLCYPYKKKMLNTSHHSSVDNPCVIEDSPRHVASDMQHNIHSPLHMRNIKIWKLIPEEEDMRPTWRKEYDNGMVPWEWDNAECNMYKEHFRIRVSKEVIEQQCKDSPFPSELCVHQQRVNFFENVPLSEVIEQAFHAICRWHPKGSLIDNVKWAKLSRKMRFLSNLKNSKHEIDMAFVRHSLERKLDMSRFNAILEDISLIEHPALSREDACAKLVWSSVVMLPDVNRMMWKEAKIMAIKLEAKRVCAQIRISVFARKELQQTNYFEMKAAAIFLAKHIRRFLARNFVMQLIKSKNEDALFQLQSRCATKIQVIWRRFFWRNRFICHQERRIECERQKIAVTREKLREKREREAVSVVFSDVIRIDSTFAIVTIHFHDESHFNEEVSLILKVYVPTTRETFSFNIDEIVVRECLENELSSIGRLSWDEMLQQNSLKGLTKRLMIRIVRGRPIFLFGRRNIVEKGTLVRKVVVKAADEMFVLSVFRSPHEFVFSTYQPSTRLQMRTNISIPKLSDWLIQSQKENCSTGFLQNITKHSDVDCTRTLKERVFDEEALHLLNPDHQPELLEWLVKRVVIRKNPMEGHMQIILQCEAEEERVIKFVTKVQSQWRRLRSQRCAKDKTFIQWEKIYDRVNKMYAYRNMQTDERQWEKPKLLGDDDLGNPVDCWRKEETNDPLTSQIYTYYVNYATGQSSWLSEEDAARLVQRRYRSNHESDLIGKKIEFTDIVKALKFIQGARDKYEHDPNKLSNIVNYALLCHCIDFNITGAKPIFEKAMHQSPNHPLITRAYGIFLLASCQTPRATNFQTACRLFHEADVTDPTQTKFHSATEIYFRWAMLVDAKNPLALLNYALLHQCIYKKYDHAERLYRSALAADPTNKFVTENYHLFMNELYPGGAYVSVGPPFSVLRRSTVAEERLEWAEWVKMRDEMCPKKGLEYYFFNRFEKNLTWKEPDWKVVWEDRVKRSQCVSGKTTHWQEYYDPRTKSSFFYDGYTHKYCCVCPA